MGVTATIERPQQHVLVLLGDALYECTAEQLAALLNVAKNFKAASASALRGRLRLPENYVAFVLKNEAGEFILNGGIAPSGSVST